MSDEDFSNSEDKSKEPDAADFDLSDRSESVTFHAFKNIYCKIQDNDFGYDKKGEEDDDVKKVENQHFDEAYDLSDENDESGKSAFV